MASSIINSDDGVISGTSGLKTTGGDDGVLVFQSKGTETAQINTDKQIVAAAGTASLPIYSTTGDLNTGIYFPAADNIGFATNGVIRGRWTTDGLCFGSDTAAANALDDYEEGTWTPAITGTTTTPTFSGLTVVARYVKVGRIVTATAYISWSSKTSGSGSARLTGFPFTFDASANQYQAGSIAYIGNNGYTNTNAGSFSMHSWPNTTEAQMLVKLTGAASTVYMDVATLSNSTCDLITTFTYLASA